MTDSPMDAAAALAVATVSLERWFNLDDRAELAAARDLLSGAGFDFLVDFMAPAGALHAILTMTRERPRSCVHLACGLTETGRLHFVWCETEAQAVRELCRPSPRLVVSCNLPGWGQNLDEPELPACVADHADCRRHW